MVTLKMPFARLAAEHGRQPFDSDGRKHVRIGFDCPVRWSAARTNEPGVGESLTGKGGPEGAWRSGWARDASESGAGFAVHAARAPAVGDAVELVFRLDNYCEWPMSQRALVRWSEPTEGGLCHIGVQFTS